MMNSNSTPKIVVGIGLAAVFGVAVSVFAVRAKHDSELARNASPPALTAPSDQNAADTTAPAPNAAAQMPTDQTAPSSTAQAPAPSAAPSVVAPPAAPAAPPTTGSSMKDSSSKDAVNRHVARTRNSGSTANTRVASADSDTTSSAPAGAPADVQQAAAQSGQEAATGAGPAATGSEPVASDSQITSAVKSEIASAAPSSKVDVTTTDGTVVLAGSVPSQDNVDEAKQAAQRVPGVKHVDASGLTVSNQ
jgi:hyperosmotically inducible periplasmic protein